MNEASHSTEQPQRSAGKTIARNTAFGLGAQFTLRIASFIFNIAVIRTLGGEQFGQYSIVGAWVMLFGVIGDLGITQYLTREIARDPKRSNDLFWDTVSLRFVLAIVACIITTVGAVLYGYSTEIVIAIGLFTSTYFLQTLIAPLSSILNGNERVDITAILGLITQILFMLFAGLFLFLGLDFVWLVIATIITNPIMLILHYWTVRRNHLGPPRFHTNPDMWWTILRAGLPFALIQLALSLSYRFDTIILSTHVSDTEVGWYNAAYALTLTLLTTTRALNDAILPSLAREHAANPSSVRPWYYRFTKGIVFLGLPIAIGTTLLAVPLIVLLYKQEFAPAATALAILTWTIPFNIFHAIGGSIAVSITEEGRAARIFLSMAIINIAANALLIPQFGIIGSSFATVLTDFFGAAQFYVMFRREFGSGLQFNKLVRLAAAAVIMGVFILLLPKMHLLLTIILGGLFYLTLVWVSGAFTQDEKAHIFGKFKRWLQPS